MMSLRASAEAFSFPLPLSSLFSHCPSVRALQLWNAAINDTIQGPHKPSTLIQGLHNSSWLWGTGDGVLSDSYSAFGGNGKKHSFH
mmetsp:Transcript_39927/g.81774  ORF Transcript_39927/g.81774 Transcript_39927/m.81774 type:complete len:86 (+) Transcript_39927:251-508(+)